MGRGQPRPLPSISFDTQELRTVGTKTRTLPLVAAGFFLASLLFPYWVVMMRAPTYPERALVVRVYAYKYEGDIDEWNRVGRLVGVRVPPPIPDIIFWIIPIAILTLVLLCLLAAWRERWLTVAAVSPWLVLAFLVAWAQYSLYVFGHTLDPNRPLRYIQPFTPPVIGVVSLGKIRTYHFPFLGSFLYGIGAVLTGWTAWQRRREAGQ